MGDLNDREIEVLQSAEDFLDVLESTPMTKSFRMLPLSTKATRSLLPPSTTTLAFWIFLRETPTALATTSRAVGSLDFFSGFATERSASTE